jgi:imidazolonepropionase-like amidohydrolase
VSFAGPGITAGGFNREELEFIAHTARGLGLEVMAHANGEAAILAAAEAGVRSVEHGFFMTERSLEALAGRGTYWTPTVGALVRAAGAAVMPDGMRSRIAALIERHLEMIATAHGFGVPLAVGTDCVLPDPAYKSAYEAELSYFERAGLPREDVLSIACREGAGLLGLINAP